MDELARAVIPDDVDLSLLVHPTELALMRKMESLADFVALAARDRAAFRLTHYSQELASLYHAFYTECRVIGVDPALQHARLALCDAVRTVLALALSLLGISAPIAMESRE